MVADLVINLADDGWDIEMSPCAESDHYVLIAEKCYGGEIPTVFPNGSTIH